MGLWDKLTGEFVDIIEWTNSDRSALVYRFERYGNEIKNGAMLIVREGQQAVFVHEGEIADVFGPGTYQLETANLPLLSTLQNWQHGFSSPFKAEVYFFSTTRVTDLKWGTKNPVMLRDREFGPVRLRAFGTYEIRIDDPVLFLQEIVGTDGDVFTREIAGQLRNLILSRFAAALGGLNIPVLDLAANYEQLGDIITERIAPEFEEYGLYLTRLLIENVSLPPAVEEALDRRTSMGIVGDLDAYMKFQSAESMRAAAENPSSGASAGIGMGMGFGMANQMANMFGQQQAAAPAASAPAAPPPLPGGPSFHVALNGTSQGPFPVSQLGAMARSGSLTRETLVWSEGMAGWQAASTVSALASLFAAAPPPLPPQ